MTEHYAVTFRLEGSTEIGVWAIEDDRVRALVDGPAAVDLPMVSGETIRDAIARSRPDLEIQAVVPMMVAPRHHHPRIYRPDFNGGSPGAQMGAAGRELQMQIQQVRLLYERLEAIFRHIHPVTANLGAYGQETRNLLILAATEVEAMWTGILRANGVRQRRYSTVDFVRLLPALRLDQYRVLLAFHPWLGEIQPFHGWSAAAPTQSLLWYDAYNAVKHDRELSFSRATLSVTISAVLACSVLLFAQAGPSVAAIPVVIRRCPTWAAHELYYDGNDIPLETPYPF